MPAKLITKEQAAEQWNKNWAKLSLPQNALGSEILYEGRKYTVIGLGLRLRKNGLIVEDAETKEERRIPVEVLKNENSPAS